MFQEVRIRIITVKLHEVEVQSIGKKLKVDDLGTVWRGKAKDSSHLLSTRYLHAEKRNAHKYVTSLRKVREMLRSLAKRRLGRDSAEGKHGKTPV